MSVKIVNDNTAIMSLRESDFDYLSAYGEVIDNSIQAKADRISIRFKTQQVRRREQIQEIAFGDNGSGMPPEVLHRCLQLGYSSRFNDRNGIGRFGVGMTLAAIHECKRIEVYSKLSDHPNWMFTYIDLDELTTNPPIQEGIPEPIAMVPPKDYMSLLGEDSGTLVIWKKYDRQSITAAKMIPEARIWIGRTFRYFIWDGVEIRLNDRLVAPIDPLYARPEGTEFTGDEPARCFDPIVIDWPVPEIDEMDGKPANSRITIRLSQLPRSLRLRQGAGGNEDARARCIDRNEGISILRNRREVFYGHIPYWGRAFLEIDRWWGCEIEFDPVLDREFTVKNIKRGAVPQHDLKQKLYDLIRPTADGVREEVKAFWASQRQKDEEAARAAKADQGIVTGHEPAERIAKNTPTDKGSIDKNKDIDKESEKIAESMTEDQEQREKYKKMFQSQPFTIVDKSWRGPHFMDIAHLGGADVLEFNKDHIFFQILSELTRRIDSSEEDGLEIEKNLRTLLDLLLISYAKAESKFEPEIEYSAQDLLDELRNNWGQYLKVYLKTWTKDEGLTE